MSNSLTPHELQHARPPYPSPTPGACSNSCPLSQWCHPAISSSVILFSSYLQSFPASGSFPMSQFIVECKLLLQSTSLSSPCHCHHSYLLLTVSQPSHTGCSCAQFTLCTHFSLPHFLLHTVWLSLLQALSISPCFISPICLAVTTPPSGTKHVVLFYGLLASCARCLPALFHSPLLLPGLSQSPEHERYSVK